MVCRNQQKAGSKWREIERIKVESLQFPWEAELSEVSFLSSSILQARRAITYSGQVERKISRQVSPGKHQMDPPSSALKSFEWSDSS